MGWELLRCELDRCSERIHQPESENRIPSPNPEIPGRGEKRIPNLGCSCIGDEGPDQSRGAGYVG